MASSTAPAAKQKILDILNASAVVVALGTDVKVRWAAPTEEADYRRDLIWLGRVEGYETYEVLGGQRKDEEYTIELWCQSYRVGDDPKATEEACWALREAAATAIRADVQLSGTLNQQIEMSATDMDTQPIEQGWVAKAQCELRCQARI